MRTMTLILALFLLLRLPSAQGQAPAEPPALRSTPAVQTLLDTADKALQGNQPDEALKAAERALLAALDTKDAVGEASALRLKARVLTKLNRADEAAAAWQEAVLAWERAGDGPGQVEALGQAGVLRMAGRPEEGRALLERALAVGGAETKRPLAVARALNDVGVTFYSRQRMREALACWETELPLLERHAPDSAELARTLHNIGYVMWNGGETEAEGYLQRAVTIFEKVSPDSPEMAASCHTLGMVRWKARGDLASAADLLQRAVSILERKSPGTEWLAMNLLHLSMVLHLHGETLTAEDHAYRALAILEKPGLRSREVALCLNEMGKLALYRNDLDAAHAYHQRALGLLAPDSLDQASCLDSLGMVASSRGDPTSLAEAEDCCRRALTIREKLAPKTNLVAMSLNHLGIVTGLRGDDAAAAAYYRRALSIEENLTPGSRLVGAILHNLGIVSWRRGDLAEAESCYRRALSIEEKLLPGSPEVAASLCGLGTVAARRGNLAEAERLARQAWNIVRLYAAALPGDEAAMAYGAHAFNFTANLMLYQVRRGKPDAAFVTLEQGRAQALQRLLVERRLLGGARTGPLWNAYEKAAGERDRAMAAFSEAASALGRAAVNLAVARERRAPPGEIARLETSHQQADATFKAAQSAHTRMRVAAENAWKQVKTANPRVFAPVRSIAWQQQALPSGTLYVAFAVDEEQSHLLLLRAGRPVQAFILPIKRKNLEAQVKALLDDFTDPRSDRARLLSESRRLCAVLFPSPARKQIASASRLLLSPDGPLWQLPFAALALPGEKAVYLGAAKPLTYIQSLSLFAQIRAERSRSARKGKPLALVLGDPAFVRGPQVAQAVPAGGLKRAFSGECGLLWDRDAPPDPLPQTRMEAVQVARLYGYPSLLGEQANEARLRKSVEKVDVLHLATHGKFLPHVPMASGVLLTPPVRAPGPGETNDDGALQAWEVFSQLHLRAELAVLSACETGLGRNVAGEGIIGLTRALQYAGCRSIVASQWRVNDTSAAKLMIALHKNLRIGLAKDEALRQAMAVVRATAKTAHPYYWAAFFLTGDPHNPWRTGRP